MPWIGAVLAERARAGRGTPRRSRRALPSSATSAGVARLARRARPPAPASASDARAARRRPRRRRERREPVPAALLVDADRDDVEALRVERLQHRPRGDDGDLVLGRAAAEEHRRIAAGSRRPAAHCRHRLQRPHEVVDQVLGVLGADRDPDQPVADPGGLALVRRQLPVRGGARVASPRSAGRRTTSRRRATRSDFAQPRGGVVAVARARTTASRRTRPRSNSAGRERVVGMRRQARVPDLGDLGVAVQRTRPAPSRSRTGVPSAARASARRAGRATRRTPRPSFPARAPCGGCARPARASRRPSRRSGRRGRRCTSRSSARPASTPGIASGRSRYGDATELSTISGTCRARRTRPRCPATSVTRKVGLASGLDTDERGVVADAPRRPPRVRVDEGGLDAVAAGRPARAARTFRRRRSSGLTTWPPRLDQGREHGVHRGHAAGERPRGLGVVQRREHVVQRGVGRAAVPAVDVAGAALVDQVGVVLERVVAVVGGQPDGRRDGLLGLARDLAGVDGAGGEPLLVLLGRSSSTRPAYPTACRWIPLESPRSWVSSSA